ncbi:hypothetical protein ACIBAI_05690 [Streptomyces sp. NPDC051041]|uniref:hypothetical protein n=1 Tax=Streptomyces sp. NPDC051041 TaxID=3365640 RepID=UPI0037B62C46
MSETPPEEPPVEEPAPSVEPPAGMGPEDYEFWDDSTLTYYERQPDGSISSRPYTEAEVAEYQNELALDSLHAEAATAIQYLDERIDLCLAYLALAEPTQEEKDAQTRVLADLAAYSAGALKRLIKVLSVMLNRPI